MKPCHYPALEKIAAVFLAGVLFVLFSAAHAGAAQMTLTGLDVLERDGFNILKGKKVGIITNHTSINAAGKNAVDVISGADNVNLTAIFSPEHGFRGVAQAGIHVASSSDPKTGLPIHSLYGKTLRPSADMLKGLDLLIFDIQDIGARFYTYLTTMAYAMEEAAKYGIEFVVLDRPNPIGGVIIEGPMLAPDIDSFIAYHRVPIRHAFTMGELAVFHKTRKKLDLKLTVVKLENWRRDMFFEETAMMWVNPSPNIRSPQAEVLYPGLGCFETTNLSVGRGTYSPFNWFGAPWMNAEKLVKLLSRAPLKGVSFRVEGRTPDSDVHEGKHCPGVAIDVSDPASVRALDIFVYAVYYLRKVNKKDFVLKQKEIRKMTGNSSLFEMLQAGKEPKAILNDYRKDTESFRKTRRKFLLY